jgi:type I restriction enzyme S subunit
MKPYPKYKDSGIEWIGEVPEHWRVFRIKRLSVVKRGASPRPIDDPKYFDENGEFAWVRIADVTASERYLERTTQKLSELGSSLSVKQYPGDFFVSIAGTVGKPIITKINCCIHDGFVWFKDLKINREFFYYIFSGGELYKGLGKWGTQLNLNTETIGDVYIPLPKENEIENIVTYLSRKTHLLDTLIEKKQKLIDLLKEQRAAIINQAVTKGLNPNVKLKDSGIAWLGEIPEHWEVKKGKYLFSIVNGYPPEQINFAEDGQHTYFRVDDLNEDGHGLYLTNGKAKFILGSTASTALYQKNLILFPKRGVAILTNKVKITAIQNLFDTNIMGLNVFRNKADIVFLSYCLLTRRLDDIADTSTIPQINNKHIYPLFFPLPPLIEQKSISTFLNQYIQKTDSLILKIVKSIDHLKEYRTALISEVVTGKIDVRDSGIQEVIHS